MKGVLICGAVAAVLLLLVPAVFAAEGAGGVASAPSRPEIIYVADFDIDLGDAGQDRGLLGNVRKLREDDPEARAARLVEVLSTSLADELQRRSVPAERLHPGRRAPARGWLVRGEFLEVDEGNRVRRAMIGFGAGKTDMQVEVELIDLRTGGDRPFAVFGTDSKSGRGPGAIVMMNPYAAAAKFVLSKRAPDRDIQKTARDIAEVIVRYIDDAGRR